MLDLKDPTLLAQQIVSDPYGYERLEGMVRGGRDDIRPLVVEIAKLTSPDGFRMHLNSSDYFLIAAAVNQGIDSHLEGFARSAFHGADCLIVPEEMGILIDRLSKMADEQQFADEDDAAPDLPIRSSPDLERIEDLIRSLIEVLCSKGEDE